jgi:hypothetical protein
VVERAALEPSRGPGETDLREDVREAMAKFPISAWPMRSEPKLASPTRKPAVRPEQEDFERMKLVL